MYTYIYSIEKVHTKKKKKKKKSKYIDIYIYIYLSIQSQGRRARKRRREGRAVEEEKKISNKKQPMAIRISFGLSMLRVDKVGFSSRSLYSTNLYIPNNMN
jgi:hypothetical protein